MKIHDKQAHRELRRELRNNPTLAEQTLWQALKGQQLEGFKFRRQHSIGRYIVDFFCPKVRLIIEIDGSVHQENDVAVYDILREKELSKAGFYTIRFSNEDVLSRLPAVLDSIRETCSRRSDQKERILSLPYARTPSR